MMRNRDIIFLVYLNRSGSTFLANQMSRHPALAVAPEGHAAIRKLLGQTGPDTPLDARIRNLIVDAGEDEKLSSWQIDTNLLCKRLENVRGEVDALYALCDAFADSHRPDADSVVLKGYFLQDLLLDHGFDHLSRSRSVRAVFLLRDPRAMFASQKRSISTGTGRSMQTNPVSAAMRWRQAVRRANSLSRDRRGIVVRYEDLILRNVETLRALGEFLEIPPGPMYESVAEMRSLSEMIPHAQRDLHENVDRPPLLGRVNRWGSELSEQEVIIIQQLAGREMATCGVEAWRGYSKTGVALAGVGFLGSVVDALLSLRKKR